MSSLLSRTLYTSWRIFQCRRDPLSALPTLHLSVEVKLSADVLSVPYLDAYKVFQCDVRCSLACSASARQIGRC